MWNVRYDFTYKKFDEIGYKTFKIVYDIAIVLCETNIKKEIKLTISMEESHFQLVM